MSQHKPRLGCYVGSKVVEKGYAWRPLNENKGQDGQAGIIRVGLGGLAQVTCCNLHTRHEVLLAGRHLLIALMEDPTAACISSRISRQHVGLQTKNPDCSTNMGCCFWF